MPVPLGDIQGAVPGLPVTHVVIHAPGKVKLSNLFISFSRKKLEVESFLFQFFLVLNSTAVENRILFLSLLKKLEKSNRLENNNVTYCKALSKQEGPNVCVGLLVF